MNQAKFNHLIHISINVLKSIHTPYYVQNQLNHYGIKPIIHGRFTTFQANAHNYAVLTHYGFRTAECVYRSNLLMKKRANEYCDLIDRYYLIHNLSPFAHKGALMPYTIMITGKDGKPTGQNVLDKTNNKPTYKLYNQLHRQIMKQINKLSNIDYGIGRTENPWHLLVRLMYSHPHKHGLIFSNSPLQIYELKQSIIKTFKEIFGYKPVNVKIHMLYLYKNNKKIMANKLNLQDRLKAINDFIQYICSDYKLQLKDTDIDFIYNNFSKLTNNQRSVAFNSQLKATKGIATINHISVKKVNNQSNQILNSNLSIIEELLNPNYIYQIHLVDQIIKRNNHKRINHILAEIVQSNVIVLKYKKNSSNYNQSCCHKNLKEIIIGKQKEILTVEFIKNVGNIVINKCSSGIPPPMDNSKINYR